MGFVKYKFGSWKKQIRSLMDERLNLLDDVRRHKKLIIYHKEKIKTIKDETLISVEKELSKYLRMAGNT